MLTLSCLISQTGQTTVTFAGELDTASADQAYEYVRDAIDAHGGQVLLDMAGLSFCDARGLGALARMSRHAGQAGSPLHLVAPPPRLSGWLRKFVGGQFSGSCPMPARWTVQAVSRASWGVPVGSAGEQDGVFVAVAGGGVDGEAEGVGGAAVAEPEQRDASRRRAGRRRRRRSRRGR